MCVLGVCGSQKSVLDPQKLELHVVVSHPGGAGNRTSLRPTTGFYSEPVSGLPTGCPS